MAKRNPLDHNTASEGVYINSLFNAQKDASNGLSIDMLPYTVNLRWICEEMRKRFPTREWTEQSCYRFLMRLRKASLLNRSERGGTKIIAPDFPADAEHRQLEMFREQP